MNDYHSKYFDSINQGLTSSIYFNNKSKVDSGLFFKEIDEIILKLRECKSRIFFFGNGASAAFANHMALDFKKNGGIRSLSLSDSALITALSNDYSYETAMREFLKIEGVNESDLVITISSSGNSPNIVSVLEFCIENEIKTLSLSGLKPDNKSIENANFSIYVPMKTYGIVECIHQIFLHLILDRSMGIMEWDRHSFQNMSALNFNL